MKVVHSAFSRVQCRYFCGHIIYRIEFVKDRWWISDGNGRKTSTNGTWMLADDPTRLVNNMGFKAGSCLFKASLYS